MVYSPERNSPAGDASQGNVQSEPIRPGVRSGKRHTLHGVKDANGSSMARGYKSIHKLSAVGRPAFRSALPLLLLSCLATFGSVRLHAQSASKLAKRGEDAENRQNYDAAFEDYSLAVQKKPADLRYKASLARVRFLAAVSHVDRGRVLRQSGDLNGALTEFNRALQIDPGNQTAQQEVDMIEQSQPAPGAPPPPTPQAAQHSQVLSDLGSISGPVQLKPVSQDPITLHAVEDVKNIYQAIGKVAGINVLFDPDYTSKRIPVDLTNVSLSDALRIVSTLSGTFYKAVTPNTIFIAQNNRQKRTDLEEQAVQTFYLTNASQQNDANEVVVAIRNLLDPSVKIYLVPSQNAIVMRATPDQLLLAEKLLNDLDRARPEVVVDVAVLEVDRSVEHNLGITLPTQVTLTPQANPNTTTTNTSTGLNGTPASSNFTLNSLAHFNSNNLAVGISGGTINALLSDADTRILQNPSLRATDGQRATIKIGQKIPVATGSYNAGVSTGVASIGIQTQFTYLDVGVNIDMTPTVHYNHEITLKMKIEVSSEGPIQTISGTQEPIINQNVVEQTIQLKDGEPSLLAGLLTKNDSLSINGTPGIGELPLLKYFFTSRDKTVAKNEIVFLLIPHIVRESVLTRMNTRAIDTGTGQAIELRRNTADEQAAFELANPVYDKPAIAQKTTAANAASAMAQQLSQQAEPLKQPAVPPNPGAGATTPATPTGQVGPTGQTAPMGAPISFTVVPPSSSPAVGSTFQVAVMLGNGRDVDSVPLQMRFNPAVLQLVNVDSGDFLGRDGKAVSIVHHDDGSGLVAISTERPPQSAGVSGQGNLCTLTFKAVAPGDSSLALVKVSALNSAQANLPAIGSQAVVHVK